MIVDIFEEGRFGEILDWKDGREHGLQALVETPHGWLRHLKKLIVRGLLDLDEIGHFRDFHDLAEVLAKPFASREGKSHALRPLRGPNWAAGARVIDRQMTITTAPPTRFSPEREWENEICTRVGLFNPPRLLTSARPSLLRPRAAF